MWNAFKKAEGFLPAACSSVGRQKGGCTSARVRKGTYAKVWVGGGKPYCPCCDYGSGCMSKFW